MTLPTQAQARKAIPVATGCFDYFPKALAAVANLSRVGNDQHNPGAPLHWDRSKSTDEADALARHFLERGTVDSDGVRHSAKVAWRALALLEKEIETDEFNATLFDTDAERAEALSRDIAQECGPPTAFEVGHQFEVNQLARKFEEANSRFRLDGIYATDSETGAALPLDGVFVRITVPRTFDVWRFGFQLGELVNTTISPHGYLPGEVVGFTETGVSVLWEGFDRVAEMDPKDLRHGP